MNTTPAALGAAAPLGPTAFALSTTNRDVSTDGGRGSRSAEAIALGSTAEDEATELALAGCERAAPSLRAAAGAGGAALLGVSRLQAAAPTPLAAKISAAAASVRIELTCATIDWRGAGFFSMRTVVSDA
jgi:hypothetical protein